ncbi:hypothetical protein AB0J71_49075 [Nonomuraea sp. NPDC049637]|uniref:hypothetical protein n=1 Tax=Nonomuraea sp. NPDC049637 TaxID=3154356 RepID=UPI003413B6E1
MGEVRLVLGSVLAMPPAKRAAEVWAELNDRQRAYMRAIYHKDQEAEQFWKGARARGKTAPPASQWRWLDYGPVGGGSAEHGAVQRALEGRGIRDAGTGSTLEALEERGLIKTRARAMLQGYRLEVQLTRDGRAACRAAGSTPTGRETRARASCPRRCGQCWPRCAAPVTKGCSGTIWGRPGGG